MRFDKKEILILAELAKLHLTEEEIKLYQRQLADILAYVDKIKQVKLTKNTKHFSEAELTLNLRADHPTAGQADVFTAAHKIEKGYLVAPNVFQQ